MMDSSNVDLNVVVGAGVGDTIAGAGVGDVEGEDVMLGSSPSCPVSLMVKVVVLKVLLPTRK